MEDNDDDFLWVKLRHLRDGAVFLARNCNLAIKVHSGCCWLANGRSAHFADGGDTLVREVPINPVSAVDLLVTAIRSFMAEMTREELRDVHERIMDGYCKLCGNTEPCYCAPCYDE